MFGAVITWSVIAVSVALFLSLMALIVKLEVLQTGWRLRVIKARQRMVKSLSASLKKQFIHPIPNNQMRSRFQITTTSSNPNGSINTRYKILKDVRLWAVTLMTTTTWPKELTTWSEELLNKTVIII